MQNEAEFKLIENLSIRQNRKYEEWKRQFGRYDNYLNSAQYGPMWLSKSEIAQLVMNAMHFFDADKLRLDAYCIMSNHIHIVYSPLKSKKGDFHSMASIMHSIKSYTQIRQTGC